MNRTLCEHWNPQELCEKCHALSCKSQRTGSVCVECNSNIVEEEGDEICRPCWDVFIKTANDRRIARIKAGWTVDETGAIHPPNVTGEFPPK